MYQAGPRQGQLFDAGLNGLLERSENVFGKEAVKIQSPYLIIIHKE